MSFLYPSLLWFLLPLGLLLWQNTKYIIPMVHLMILMLLVIALSRPVEEQALQEASVKAKDIIIALDVSYSMKATDISPTRYDFAKKTIKSFLRNNPSDNIMLIAFTSNPLLLSPPTTDHRLIEVALESLNPKYILTKGTSLKKLFAKLATMRLEQKHLVLITDGGEEKNLNALTAHLLDAGVSLHILALGTTQGSTVRNKEGLALKDRQGNLVITRINPLLKHLAQAVNGSYRMPSATPQETAKTLEKDIRSSHNNTQYLHKMQYHYKEWYQLPLFFALLLFLLLHTRAVKYLFVLFSLLGISAHASFLDLYHLQRAYVNYEKKAFPAAKEHIKKIEYPSLESQLILANYYYQEQAFKQAIQTYKSIRTTSPEVKHILFYNIGNAYARLQVYTKAKIYYTKALQLSLDKDAQYNLNLIALLKDKKDASLGIAHPKSQSSDSSKSESQQKEEESKREEDQPSSGSGGGGESSSTKEQKQSKLISDDSKKELPLGSKVYDLINKGYISETQPW